MFIMLPPLLYGQNKLVEESIIYSSDISSYKKKIEKKISPSLEYLLNYKITILSNSSKSKEFSLVLER